MKVMKNIPRLIMLAVLTLIAVVFVIPIFYSVFNSFKSQKEILSTTMTFFPNSPSLENYLYVFQHGSQYLGYYVNSLKNYLYWGNINRYSECNERICLCKASF